MLNCHHSCWQHTCTSRLWAAKIDTGEKTSHFCTGSAHARVLTWGLESPEIDLSPGICHVSDAHTRVLLPARGLAAQWSHSFTLRLCSRGKIYNINTVMCHKTQLCFQSTCIHNLSFGSAVAHLVATQHRDSISPPFNWYCISWFMLHAWVL